MEVIDFGREECKRTADLLDAFLRNELSPETSQRMAEHVERCELCSAEAKSRVELQQRVRKALRQEVPDSAVRARLQSRLRRRAAGGSVLMWAAPLAAAAALFIGFYSIWNTMQQPKERWMTSMDDQRTYIQSLYTQVAEVIQVGLRDHVHCAHFRKFAETLPSVEEILSLVGGDYEELVPVVENNVPEGFQVLLGHQCGYEGRRYVHFVLGRGEELLSVIVTRREGGESFARAQLAPILEASGVPIYAGTADQFQAAGFDTDNYLVYVISNLSEEQNLQIAQTLAPQILQALQPSAG